MSETDQDKDGLIEGGQNAVVKWLPGLPRWVKTIFASFAVYLVLCFVSQIPPLALPEAVGGEVKQWLAQSRAEQSEQHRAASAERADLIALLLEQNRELRQQAASDPDLAARVRILERKMDALLDAHPKVSR